MRDETERYQWWLTHRQKQAEEAAVQKVVVNASWVKLREESAISLGFNNYADYLKSGLFNTLKTTLIKGKCKLCWRRARFLLMLDYKPSTLNGSNMANISVVCGICLNLVERCHGNVRTFPQMLQQYQRRLKKEMRRSRRVKCKRKR